MPSYKRMYNFWEKVRIFFWEICVFFVYYIVPNKKERQSLTSLTQLVRNTYMFNYYFLLLLM